MSNRFVGESLTQTDKVRLVQDEFFKRIGSQALVPYTLHESEAEQVLMHSPQIALQALATLAMRVRRHKENGVFLTEDDTVKALMYRIKVEQAEYDRLRAIRTTQRAPRERGPEAEEAMLQRRREKVESRA